MSKYEGAERDATPESLDIRAMDKELLLTDKEIEKVAKQVSEAHYHEDIRLSAKEYMEALPKALCEVQLSKLVSLGWGDIAEAKREERKRIIAYLNILPSNYPVSAALEVIEADGIIDSILGKQALKEGRDETVYS